MNALLKFYRRDRHISRLVIMLAGWLIFMAITCFDKFFSIRNFPTIASVIPEYGLMSLGAMVCMITGGIDLSGVGIANLTSITMALFMKSLPDETGYVTPWMVPLVLLMAILCGLCAGAVNGTLISKVKIPPILATLGSTSCSRASPWSSPTGPRPEHPPVYSGLINNKLLGGARQAGDGLGLIPCSCSSSWRWCC